LASKYFGFECTRLGLSQKSVVHTKFDIYAFINRTALGRKDGSN